MKNRHWVDRYVELVLAIVLILWATGALGQSVNSDQIKKKTDGGLVGDTAKALAVGIVRASSAPSSPVTGQLWCDTTLSPCTLKQYTGSTWIAPQVNAAITTQADVSSFPGSPVDGQIFYSKAERYLWVYDSTAALWRAIGTTLTQSGGNIVDTYTAAVITAPASAPTAATSGTAGSTGSGSYSWKVTFRNANGGETTPSAASNVVTPGASKSADLSSIPLGGAGTTQRNIYRTASGNGNTGPWLYVGNIADNTTTTYHDGAADGALPVPDINFSGAMPGTWVARIPGGTATTGGCGTTSRNTLACYAGTTGLTVAYNVSNDGGARATLDISAYSTGNYTAQYKITRLSGTGDYNTTVVSPAFAGMRRGTADNAIRIVGTIGGAAGGGAEITLPFSSSNHSRAILTGRSSAAGSSSDFSFWNNPWPEIDALPIWVRWVRRGSTLLGYWSTNGSEWTNSVSCTNGTNTNSGCTFGAAYTGATNFDNITLEMMSGAVARGNTGWIEIKDFTLKVDP